MTTGTIVTWSCKWVSHHYHFRWLVIIYCKHHQQLWLWLYNILNIYLSVYVMTWPLLSCVTGLCNDLEVARMNNDIRVCLRGAWRHATDRWCGRVNWTTVTRGRDSREDSDRGHRGGHTDGDRGGGRRDHREGRGRQPFSLSRRGTNNH